MVNNNFPEVIFVGLPGPSHNYGGLSGDNVASSTHRGQVSHPREAALQVLALIRLMKKLGLTVGILPPQLRPNPEGLKPTFTGEPQAAIAQAAREAPALLEAASSSSAMWVANAATVCAAPDCADELLHIAVANLHTNLHRRIEAKDTYKVLKAIFASVPNCVVHPRLPAMDGFYDEGAANHMRLAPSHDKAGLNVFVYGTDGRPGDPKTARQNLVASEALSAQAQLPHQRALFVKQNPDAIAAGVFHNDVIAVANESVLLLHEKAYAGGFADIARIEAAYQALNPERSPVTVVIKESLLAMSEAVATYFFNSQLVSTADGMALIAPQEVESKFSGKAKKLLECIVADTSNPINALHIVDLRQSMNNGGGPACLRLRVPMSEAQLAAVAANVNVLATDDLLEKIEAIISRHYPPTLEAKDLANPALYECSKTVLAELGALMKLPL